MGKKYIVLLGKKELEFYFLIYIKGYLKWIINLNIWITLKIFYRFNGSFYSVILFFYIGVIYFVFLFIVSIRE